jgi:hypothetical protein
VLVEGSQPAAAGSARGGHFASPEGGSGHESGKVSIGWQDLGGRQIEQVAGLINQAQRGVGRPDVINDPNNLVAPWVVKPGSRRVNKRVMQNNVGLDARMESQEPLHSRADRFGAQLGWRVGSVTGPKLVHGAVILPIGRELCERRSPEIID